MIGKEATLPDIVLQEEFGQPIDLQCYENLTAEVPAEQELEAEEELIQGIPYKVIATCGGGCGARLRVFVLATDAAIRSFQELLLEELQFLCPQCREEIRNGGR